VGNGPLLAIDIGTTKVCALVGDHQGGDLHIIGHGLVPCQGLRRGVVVDIDQTSAAVRAAVERAHQMADAAPRAAFVGVTGAHILGVNSSGGIDLDHSETVVSAEDIDLVRAAADRVADLPGDREILHSIPRTYRVDGEDGVRHPEGMSASRLEVDAHVIAAARNSLDNIERSVVAAGLTVDEMVAESLATARAVLAPGEEEIGVALLDIGGGTVDIAIVVRGAVCHTAAIPVAGDHITRDIAVGLRIGQDDAERLKVHSGSALAEKIDPHALVNVSTVGSGEARTVHLHTLAEIIEARAREIFELARDEIAQSGFGPQLAAGVCLTGGASLLRHAVALARSILRMPVRLGTPAMPGIGEGLRSPVYATAVGLLRYAAEQQRAREASVAKQAVGWWRRCRRAISAILRW
jgi:cell division protein FtsA